MVLGWAVDEGKSRRAFRDWLLCVCTYVVCVDVHVWTVSVCTIMV